MTLDDMKEEIEGRTPSDETVEEADDTDIYPEDFWRVVGLISAAQTWFNYILKRDRRQKFLTNTDRDQIIALEQEISDFREEVGEFYTEPQEEVESEPEQPAATPEWGNLTPEQRADMEALLKRVEAKLRAGEPVAVHVVEQG